MGGIGARLRTIRRQWQLSLREVEKRSLRLVQEKSNQSYQVSASWLNRLEREEHDLTVSKLMALAEIYNVSTEQLLRSIHPENGQNLTIRQLSSQNANVLPTEGPIEASCLLPDTLVSAQPPGDETTLLSARNAQSRAPYRWGIIGKRDTTLDPMVPAGSFVQIDTQKRAISTRRNWTHEFQRPIYFLMTRDAYVCGWCELDKNSDWLTLIPHPLSRAPNRRWRYGYIGGTDEITTIRRTTLKLFGMGVISSRPSWRVSTAEIPHRRRRVNRGRLPSPILLPSDVAAWGALPETCFSTKQSRSVSRATRPRIRKPGRGRRQRPRPRVRSLPLRFQLIHPREPVLPRNADLLRRNAIYAGSPAASATGIARPQ
jgi:transcriptional regulator with XRE-family HTH domain